MQRTSKKHFKIKMFLFYSQFFHAEQCEDYFFTLLLLSRAQSVVAPLPIFPLAVSSAILATFVVRGRGRQGREDRSGGKE